MRLPFVFTGFLCLTLASCSLPWVKEEEAPIVKSEETLQLERDAEGGDREAQYQLGIKYYNGEEEPQDPAIAVEWFRKAAEQGYDNAEYTMGFMTEKGNGTSKNLAKAIEWYAKAANKGHEAAIYHLGLAHATIDPPDLVSAFAWLSLVSDGDTRAAQALVQVNADITPEQKAQGSVLLEELRSTVPPINQEPAEESE